MDDSNRYRYGDKDKSDDDDDENDDGNETEIPSTSTSEGGGAVSGGILRNSAAGGGNVNTNYRRIGRIRGESFDTSSVDNNGLDFEDTSSLLLDSGTGTVRFDSSSSAQTTPIKSSLRSKQKEKDPLDSSSTHSRTKRAGRRKRFSLFVASKASGISRPHKKEKKEKDHSTPKIKVITNNPSDLMSQSRHIRKSMGFVFDDEEPPAAPKQPRGFEAVEQNQNEPAFQLGDPINNNETYWGRIRNTAGAYINNRWIQYGVTGLIVLNAIVLGSLTFLYDNPEATAVLENADLAMLIMFTCEICIQLFYLGFREFVKNGWMMFDGGIILFSWIFIDSQLSIFRSFRIFRLFALVSRWTSLRRLFKAVGRTMPKMATIGAALMLFFFTFCVLYTSLYHNLYDEGVLDYDYFGRLDFTFLTLFQFMTLDSWTGVVRQVMEKHPYSWLGFMAWVVVTAFFVLNLVVAVICESLIDLHNSADETHQSQLLSHQKGMMETQTQELMNETRQVLTLQREMLANQVAMATTLVEIMKHLKEHTGPSTPTSNNNHGGGGGGVGGRPKTPQPTRPTKQPPQYDYGRKDSLAKMISDMGPMSSDDDDDDDDAADDKRNKDNHNNKKATRTDANRRRSGNGGGGARPSREASDNNKSIQTSNSGESSLTSGSNHRYRKRQVSSGSTPRNPYNYNSDDDDKSLDLDFFDLENKADSSSSLRPKRRTTIATTGASGVSASTDALAVKRMLEASLASFGNFNITPETGNTPRSTNNNSMVTLDELDYESTSDDFASEDFVAGDGVDEGDKQGDKQSGSKNDKNGGDNENGDSSPSPVGDGIVCVELPLKTSDGGTRPKRVVPLTSSSSASTSDKGTPPSNDDDNNDETSKRREPDDDGGGVGVVNPPPPAPSLGTTTILKSSELPVKTTGRGARPQNVTPQTSSSTPYPIAKDSYASPSSSHDDDDDKDYGNDDTNRRAGEENLTATRISGISMTGQITEL